MGLVKFFTFFCWVFFVCLNVHAQNARNVVRLACEDGSKTYSSLAIINTQETYKIASETDENSPERIRRLQILEGQRDNYIGLFKVNHRKTQEEWIKGGMDPNVASLYKSVMDLTLFITLSLSYKNPHWDQSRLIVEAQDECERSNSR